MRDPINEVVMPLIGLAIVAALLWYDVIPFKVVKAILWDMR